MAFSDNIVGKLRQIGPDDTLLRDLEIVREAGAGGMGRVYEAIDGRTRRRIALKILARESDVDRARFAAEASALERLRHPAIVGYVAHGVTEDGGHFLAMEWLDGETLAQRLERGPLSIVDAVILGRRVAEALALAHREGIVHRDLKPSNLLLDGGQVERVKIVDFGIAREIGAERDLTETGQMIGTPGYMSPEQARGRKDLDGRTDLFALGCVLFRCLTGRPVFEGEEIISVLSKLILHDPPRVGDLSAGVPKQLERLIARMLAKEPSARPASADVVAAELRPMEDVLVRGEELPPVPASVVVREPTRRAGDAGAAPHEPPTVTATLVAAGAAPAPVASRASLPRRRYALFALAGGAALAAVVVAALRFAPAPPTAPSAPAAPTALACSDAIAAGGAPIDADLARALGAGACARLAIALGVPWRSSTGSLVRVVLGGEGDATTITLTVAGLEASGRGAPLVATARAVAEFERVARERGFARAESDPARWGASSAAEAKLVEREWRRFDLGLAGPPDEATNVATTSPFHHLASVVQSKAGTSRRREAIEQGLASLASLPEARRLAVEAYLTFYRDQSPAKRDVALESARRARDLDPADPDVASMLASLLLLAGNRDEGLAQLDRLVREHPTNAVRGLRLATSQPYDRDLARSRRYVDAMVSVLPEMLSAIASIRMLVLEGRLDDARAAIALGAKLDPERESSLTSTWLELAALEPEAARRLATRRMANDDRGLAADAAFAMVGSYHLEGRIAEALSLEQRQVEALRATQPVLAAFHAYHNVRVRRWLGRPTASAAMLDVLATGASNATQLSLSRTVRLSAELALAAAKADPRGEVAARAKLGELEALCERESLGDPVELQSALAGTLPLVRHVLGDRAAVERFAATEQGDFEARRRVALDAALAYDALGEDAHAADAYQLAMDPSEIESEAFPALVARAKLARLHRRMHRDADASALEAVVARLLARADAGVAGAIASIR